MSAAAAPPRTYTIPKPAGGRRLMTRLAPADARLWHELAVAAAPAVEASLDPAVLGNRWDVRSGRLAPVRPALGAAREAARRVARASDVLVRTDVRACYASIAPAVLERTLRRRGVDRALVLAAARATGRWNDAGVPGLPVGPEASALWANAVLADADAELRRAGLRFLRWVDDVLLDPGRRDPLEAVAVVDEALGAVGLERNCGKTSVQPAARPGAWPGRASLGSAGP